MSSFINGEVHLAELPPKFVAQAVKESDGSAQQVVGGMGQGIIYAGNYWGYNRLPRRDGRRR